MYKVYIYNDILILLNSELPPGRGNHLCEKNKTKVLYFGLSCSVVGIVMLLLVLPSASLCSDNYLINESIGRAVSTLIVTLLTYWIVTLYIHYVLPYEAYYITNMLIMRECIGQIMSKRSEMVSTECHHAIRSL